MVGIYSDANCMLFIRRNRFNMGIHEEPAGGVISVAIGIITYKRNLLLERLLASLESEQRSNDFHVVIVDNDASAGASNIVRNSRLSNVIYEVESVPGIVAARNRVLDLVPEGTEAVVFVDDDEMVHEGWFRALLSSAREHDADVVLGPVLSMFPQGAPQWITRGNFIQRPSMTSGTILKTAATNNVLIRLEALSKLDVPRFDESYSLTGGSDAELFWRMRQAGAKIVWAADAVVEEDVPPGRANLRWILRRNIRYGNVSGRLLHKRRSRAVVFLLGIGRISFGLATAVIDLLRGRGLQEKSFGHFSKGIGMVGASIGSYVVEYRRLP